MKRYLLVGLGLVFLTPSTVRSDEVPEKYRPAVKKALDYLASKQSEKGHWGGAGEQYPVAMTALAGMALLMEGSTVNNGPYQKNIKLAMDWLMDRCQKGGKRDGLVGNPDNQNEAARYMYGHGFGLLFLASCYGEEKNQATRDKLKDILERAVKYTADAQSSRGGWYYTSKAEGGDNDEGSVTITQVQALRACRNAGIPVAKDIIKKAQDYLKDCTSPNGAVYYSFRSHSERPAITAAAIACGFNAGEYKGDLIKKWFKYCKDTIPAGLGGNQPARIAHDEYTHYYFAQSVYILGDKGWERLFGPTAVENRLTWTKYREATFDHLLKTQNNDGSWSGSGGFNVGGVYSTAMYAAIMQLDIGALPIYQK